MKRNILIKLTVLFLIVVLTLTGCKSIALVDTYEAFGIPFTTKFFFSHCEERSFFKLKIDSIKEGAYSQKWYREMSVKGLLSFDFKGAWQRETRYLLMECTVLEDYYGNVQPNTQITVIMELRYEIFVPTISQYAGEIRIQYIDYSTMKDFFSSYELFYLYAPFLQDEQRLYSLSNFTYENIGFQTHPIYISHVLPILNGKLDIKAVDAFRKDNGLSNEDYSEITEDFTDYFRDGMSDAEVAESIKRLRAEQEEDSSSD